jgi:pimeloyl-ACP methyl ester carboxylesterase
MSANGKPSIVFCHGIWADGSSFSKVIPALQAEGYEAMAVQYGLESNEDDVARTLATLGRVSSPAILVGHSYGGSVITAAGTDDRVAGLVYVAGPRARRGGDVADAARQLPAQPGVPVRPAGRRTPLAGSGRRQGVLRRSL